LEYRFRLHLVEEVVAGLKVTVRSGLHLVIHVVFPVLGVVILALAIARGWPPRAMAWVGAAAGLAFTPLVVLLSVLSARLGGGERHVALDDDGIVVMARGGVARAGWESLAEVEETGRLFLFFATPRAAIAIPKRVVGTERDLARLRAYVRDRAGARARLRGKNASSP
jgi:hypothetical protein